jgi:hypothetical protein
MELLYFIWNGRYWIAVSVFANSRTARLVLIYRIKNGDSNKKIWKNTFSGIAPSVSLVSDVSSSYLLPCLAFWQHFLCLHALTNCTCLDIYSLCTLSDAIYSNIKKNLNYLQRRKYLLSNMYLHILYIHTFSGHFLYLLVHVH